MTPTERKCPERQHVGKRGKPRKRHPTNEHRLAGEPRRLTNIAEITLLLTFYANQTTNKYAAARSKIVIEQLSREGVRLEIPEL